MDEHHHQTELFVGDSVNNIFTVDDRECFVKLETHYISIGKMPANLTNVTPPIAASMNVPGVVFKMNCQHEKKIAINKQVRSGDEISTVIVQCVRCHERFQA